MNKNIRYYLLNKYIIIIFMFLILFFTKNGFINKSKSQKNIPKVSIFLPIYNKNQFLIRSIRSIQNQTLKDVEIIAVNDGSTDRTLHDLKKLAKKDLRIKIVNNDRNHGLLYSRAMGILNCTGEYVMNLDPDDRLEGDDNLEVLYKTSKASDLDLLRYLIKIIPLNDYQIEESNNFNKNQFNMLDFFITNKFVKKKTILKAYDIFKSRIFSNKWNFHEDNIWNFLIRRSANTSSDINKFIYIYKMNDQSLMINKNIVEIKNRLYLMKAFQELNIKFYDMFLFFGSTIRRCNNLLLRDIEIKKKFIHISIHLFELYINNNFIIKSINYLVNKISENKIIIFNNSFDYVFDKYLIHISIYKFLAENYNKKIISVNMNNTEQFNDILTYIFPNDIIIGLDEIIFNSNFNKIINNYPNNKIIIFCQNINERKINLNINLMNNSNIIAYTFNNNSYEIMRKTIKKEYIFFYPGFIIHAANFFNFKNSLIKNNILIVLEKNISYLNDTIIKNIISKYYTEINYLNSIEKINLNNLLEIIQRSQLILTDNPNLMELSAIHFISCILFKNNTENENNTDLINKLDYIKYVYNLEELEENIIKLKKLSNNFEKTIFSSLYGFT